MVLPDNLPVTACPNGTYRSRSDPADACLPCPANTVRNGAAVASCPCIAGYFRAPLEGLNVNCTRKSHCKRLSHADQKRGGGGGGEGGLHDNIYFIPPNIHYTA